jgi:hypothetical protein
MLRLGWNVTQDDNHNIPAVGVAIEADRKTTTMRITGFDLSIGTNEPVEGEEPKLDPETVKRISEEVDPKLLGELLAKVKREYFKETWRHLKPPKGLKGIRRDN